MSLPGQTYLELLAEHGVDGAHPGGLALTRALLKGEKLNSSTRLLEVGCGTGQTAAYIVATYGCQVVALDLNPKMLERARQRCACRPEVILIQGDARHLPFWANSFDLVLAESVTVFTEIRRALREYYRVLTPGGTLLDIELTAWSPLSKGEREEVARVYGINQVPTREEWTGLLQAAGFSRIQAMPRQIPLALPAGKMLSKYFRDHFRLMRHWRHRLGYCVYRCQ